MSLLGPSILLGINLGLVLVNISQDRLMHFSKSDGIVRHFWDRLTH